MADPIYPTRGSPPNFYSDVWGRTTHNPWYDKQGTLWKWDESIKQWYEAGKKVDYSSNPYRKFGDNSLVPGIVDEATKPPSTPTLPTDYVARYGLDDPGRYPTTPPPTGYNWGWDDNTQSWTPKSIVSTTPSPLEAAQTTKIVAETGQIGKPRETYPLPSGQAPFFIDASGNIWTWDERIGDYNQTGYDPKAVAPNPQIAIDAAERASRLAWDKEQAGIGQQQWQSEFDYNKLQNQQALEWSQKQFGMQQEAQKAQQLANLRANPASWLEYASMAGQAPVVQPWMVPLGQAGQGLRAGAPIPGYNPQGTNMNLPELTSPSAQYMSRIAPSAQAQYAGYQQAATGATPQDTNWQLWNRSAPSGQYGGLSYGR